MLHTAYSSCIDIHAAAHFYNSKAHICFLRHPTHFLAVQSAEVWRANWAAPNWHSHCLLGVVTESWASSVDGAYTPVVIPLWCCAVCKQAVINDYLEEAGILSAWGGNDRLAHPPHFHPIWKRKYLAPTCRVVLLIPVWCNFWEFRWASTYPGVCKCVRARVSEEEEIVLKEVNRVSWFPAPWHKQLQPSFQNQLYSTWTKVYYFEN
jgi:hypothetical protein